MAKPINTVHEILLLEPSVGLEALGALPAETAVREFQRILGGGQLCEEVDVLEIKRAEEYKDMLSSVADALGNIDNLSGLDEKAVLSLWAVLSEGDGDVFYYHPSENRFIAHYHDPDVLVQIGNSLSQAVNAALDANPYFVPADFSPVYWKPRSLYAMRFGGSGCN